jgi:hypothetical protein
MRAPHRTIFTVFSQFLAVGLIACQVAEDAEDDYRNLPSLSTDSCVADCEDGDGGNTPDIPGGDVCDYRTQTQGGWGAKCNGDNPGCFRDAHFAEVFPTGLQIGCGTLTATLKNSKAVEKGLPSGGKPRKLLPSEAGQYDGVGDPDPKTVLFGQATALSLNVHFDAVPEFNPLATPVPLAQLVIADPSSPCAGMTVAQVLAEVNDVLGGCPSSLTASQANACATLINQSFVDGGESCSPDFEFGDPIPG